MTTIPLYSLQAAWTVLSAHGWLAERDAVTRQLLRGIARLKTCEPRAAVYRYGDPPDGIYGLVTGSVDISIPRLDGQEVLMHRAETGYWVGDLALFARQQRLVSVSAATACRLVHLPQDGLAALVREHPALMTDFYELSHRNVEVLLTLLGNLAVQGAENRIALRLLMQQEALPEGETWIRVSQDRLATLVALSPQSVRRSLHKLENDGFVETAYGKIRVVDQAGLASLCGYVRRRRTVAQRD